MRDNAQTSPPSPPLPPQLLPNLIVLERTIVNIARPSDICGATVANSTVHLSKILSW